MDVEDLIRRATEASSEEADVAEEESVTPADEPEQPAVEQDGPETADESVNEPVEDVPADPVDDSEVPVEESTDADVSEPEEEYSPVQDESDDMLPEPAVMPDETPEPEPEMDTPEDPVDTIEEAQVEEDELQPMDLGGRIDDRMSDVTFGGMQEDDSFDDDLSMPIDDSGEEQETRRRSERPVEVKMPDGWEAGISRTVQQRMMETQEVVNAHLDDELAQSIYQLDVLGSD